MKLFRCPVCTQGDLFKPLCQVRSIAELCLPPEKCGNCGFRFRREPGYYFGVLTPVLPLLALVAGAACAGLYYWVAQPENILELLIPGGVGVALGFVIFFRPALAIYVRIDHAVDPANQAPR